MNAKRVARESAQCDCILRDCTISEYYECPSALPRNLFIQLNHSTLRSFSVSKLSQPSLPFLLSLSLVYQLTSPSFFSKIFCQFCSGFFLYFLIRIFFFWVLGNFKLHSNKRKLRESFDDIFQENSFLPPLNSIKVFLLLSSLKKVNLHLQT